MLQLLGRRRWKRSAGCGVKRRWILSKRKSTSLRGQERRVTDFFVRARNAHSTGASPRARSRGSRRKNADTRPDRPSQKGCAMKEQAWSRFTCNQRRETRAENKRKRRGNWQEGRGEANPKTQRKCETVEGKPLLLQAARRKIGRSRNLRTSVISSSGGSVFRGKEEE